MSEELTCMHARPPGRCPALSPPVQPAHQPLLHSPHLGCQVLSLLPSRVHGISFIGRSTQGQRPRAATAAQRGRAPWLPHKLTQFTCLAHAA